MRWLLSTWGSLGDLHPFLALGRGLIARGHEVTLVGHPDWAAEAERSGLRFVSTDEPSRDDFIEKNPQILRMSWGGLVSLHTLVHEGLLPSFPYLAGAMEREVAQHDVLVAHHFCFPAAMIAEKHQLPYATVTLAPGVIPSAHTLPGGHFGRTGSDPFSRLRQNVIWSVGRWIARSLFDPVINRQRTKAGVEPMRGAIFDHHSKRLNLQLYSPEFASKPPDWSSEKRVAGFCFYDPPQAQTLSPEIEKFLAAGASPVLFTLGSTAVRVPGNFYHDAVRALQTLGLRGILLIGPEANRPTTLPADVLAVPYAPYGLLMPHVRAVVHQGGIGTLSHTLRAGVPSVVLPFAFDQPNNARRLEALGVAEVLLPHQRTEPHLVRALRRLLEGAALEQARQLGERIRAEDGVARACAILEETFG